jgi:hypothetical protein
MSGWTAKLFKQNQRVYYVQHKPKGGDACYFFLLLHAQKETEFLHAIKHKPVFDLRDYGDVIDSGFGDEAPEQVMEWIKNWYELN